MGTVKPDGSFQLTNVAPGEYTLMAISNAGVGDQQIIAAPLTVAGEDITGVILQRRPGFARQGRSCSTRRRHPPAWRHRG